MKKWQLAKIEERKKRKELRLHAGSLAERLDRSKEYGRKNERLRRWNTTMPTSHLSRFHAASS